MTGIRCTRGFVPLGGTSKGRRGVVCEDERGGARRVEDEVEALIRSRQS